MSKSKTPPAVTELLKWAREAKEDLARVKQIRKELEEQHAPKLLLAEMDRRVKRYQESCIQAHTYLYWYHRGVSDGFNKNLRYIRKFPNLTPEERLLYAIFDESGKRRKKATNERTTSI